MKHALLLALALLPLLAAPLRAAVDSPNFVDYQGMVFDSTTGAPLGSAGTAPNFTAAAKNYTMQFRIFGSQAGTDLIYAESQTVTVTLGAFSVRLGSGAPIAGLIPPPTKAFIQDAFDGADRFLELTVFPTGASIGTPITPRLKFQSAPFAFVAKHAAVADEVIGKVTATAGSTFAGTVTATAGSTFTGDGAGLTGLTSSQIPILDASKINSGTLDTDRIPALPASKINSGTLADARLSSNVALLSRNPQRFGGVTTFDGFVGIGTGGSAPVCPLEVKGLYAPLLTGRYFNGSSTGIGLIGSTQYVSLKSEWYVQAFGYVAVSDKRIKHVVRQSESLKDLDAIQKLKVTDYRLIDHIQEGGNLQKGFLAQEVQKIIPEAVHVDQGYIPSIYAVAEGARFDPDKKTLSLTMDKVHDLKVGEMVRLIGDEGIKELKVIEVNDRRSFSVGPLDAEMKRVFVYGKQVADFLSVDYNRIFTTGISAIQQLKIEKDAQVKELRDENAFLDLEVAELKERVAALEAKDQSRDAKLAAIEKLLATPAQAAVRSVSVNTAAAH